MKFKNIGIILVSVSLLTGIIGIGFAFAGYSYWALVYRMIIGSVLIFLIQFIIAKVPLGLHFNFKGLKSFAAYSAFNFLFGFVNFFSRNLDNLLIGKYLGAASLGYYDKAYNLMKMPLSNITTVITPVLHPVLSSPQSDDDTVLSAHLKLIKLLALIGTPISVFLFYNRYEIITILYGHQWILSIEPFKWLALSVWMQMVTAGAGAFFQIKGKTNLLFIAGILSLSLKIPAFIIGIYMGSIEKVSFFLLIAITVNLFMGNFILYKYVFKKNILLFFKALKKPVIIGVLVFISVFPVSHLELNLFTGLIIKTIIIGVSVLLGFWMTGEWKFVFSLFKRKI